jgi:hypothetical protein
MVTWQRVSMKRVGENKGRELVGEEVWEKEHPSRETDLKDYFIYCQHSHLSRAMK